MSDVRLFTVPSDAAQNDVRLFSVNLYGGLGVTLDDATLVSEGTAPFFGIVGTLSVTLDDATVSSVGALALKGTLSVTLGDATLSSVGALALKGTLPSTLGDVALSSVGALALKGTLSSTLGDVALSSAGRLALKGSLGVTLADATLVSASVLALKGTASVTLDAATLASTGTLAGSGISGSLGVTLDGATLVATGTTPSSLQSGTPLRGKRPRARTSYSSSGGASEELADLQQLDAATTKAIDYLSLPKPLPPPRSLATVISSLAVDLALPVAVWIDLPAQSGALDQMRTELRELQRQIAMRVAIEERLRAEARDEDEALALLLA